MTRLTALLTCHNRRESTLACLRRLGEQEGSPALDAVLVDDGSTDGTAEAVSASFPWVTLIAGNGQRFWNGGMHDAFAMALARDPDHYLWLNDDTLLDHDAVVRLVAAHEELRRRGMDGIVSGSVRDPRTGKVTYGGVVRDRPRSRPSRFRQVEPADDLVAVETVHGNCVLIPRVVVKRIGTNDPAFTHGMGDFDYGLRARTAGFEVVLAPGTFGTCARNPPPLPPEGPFSRRMLAAWRRMTAPKGLPPRDWALFMRRWGGPAWPLFWVSPYLHALAVATRGSKAGIPSGSRRSSQE